MNKERIAKMDASKTGAWVKRHNPEVGGYFVIADTWSGYATSEEFRAYEPVGEQS